ncbi:MAG: hypothetical protein QXG00_06925 [Candidatus Woesearchaeota archaeon]
MNLITSDNPKNVQFNIFNYYNGEIINLTDDYYKPERDRINNLLDNNYLDLSKGNIFQRIQFIMDSFLKLTNVRNDVQNQLEKDRENLINKYQKEIDRLNEDYEKHKNNENERIYSEYDMPGRVDNHLKLWLEIIKKPLLYISDDQYNKDYKLFYENTVRFINYLQLRIYEEFEHFHKLTLDNEKDQQELIKLKEYIISNFNININKKKIKKHANKQEFNLKHEKKVIEDYINYLKDYFLKTGLVDPSSINNELILELENGKIKTNLKLKEFVRLLYIFIKENEELAEKYYNFQNYKNIFNFIKNHIIIFETSKTKCKNTIHQMKINQDTIRKYYKDTISDYSKYENWKEKKYYNKFFEAFKEFHCSNQQKS